MKNYLYGIFAIAFLAFTACTNEELPTPGTGQDTPVEHKSGEILVKFSPYVSKILDKTAAATRSGGPATRSGILSVDEVLDIVGGYQIERVFPVDGRNEERTRESELHLWYVVRFGDDYSAEQVAEKLSALGEVQHVNLNRTIRRAYNAGKKAMPLTREALAAMQRATRAAGDTGYPFNDELLPMQWHLINRGNLFGEKSIVDADVQCEEAWKSSTGDKSIIVAVLDEGVMVEHPDLKNSMWVNEGEVYRSKQDNDGNGYKGDVYGYNFVFETGVISWDDINDTGHGTHVAGVIAAQNNNGIGISSIAGGNGDIPGVKIMSCQIFSGNTVSNSLATVRAIKYAADNGAVILQCSWGYVSGSANSYEWGTPGFKDEEEWATNAPLEKDALDYFLHNAGSPNGPIEGGLAIFAGGNESAPQAGFPGAAEACISVSATAADYTPAVYTNYGPGTTIAAPGGDQDYYYEYFDDNHKRGEIGCVLSTLPYDISETGYGYMEGTSMACPHVSGVAALGRRTAPPPLHGRRVQGTALPNHHADRLLHDRPEKLLPLRRRRRPEPAHAADAGQLPQPDGHGPGQCGQAAQCGLRQRQAGFVPEPLHLAGQGGEGHPGQLLPRRRNADLHGQHRRHGGRHGVDGGCETDGQGAEGRYDQGKHHFEQGRDAQFQHHGA